VASPALTAFNKDTEALALGRATAAVLALGVRLYLDTLKEEAGHLKVHLLAETNERTPSAELSGERTLILAVLNRQIAAGDSLALHIAEAL
jgi:hypothetical protein